MQTRLWKLQEEVEKILKCVEGNKESDRDWDRKGAEMSLGD